MVMKVETAPPGWAWIGLAVWANDKVVCSEITSPATDSAARKKRVSAPSIRPISSS